MAGNVIGANIDVTIQKDQAHLKQLTAESQNMTAYNVNKDKRKYGDIMAKVLNKWEPSFFFFPY